MDDARQSLPAARDLARYVQWFDGALEPDCCRRMIESFDQLARFQMRNSRGAIKALQSSAWTELNVSKVADSSFESLFRRQVFDYLARYNERVRLTLAIPERARLENLRIKRYLATEGDQFEPHFAGLFLQPLHGLSVVPERRRRGRGNGILRSRLARGSARGTSADVSALLDVSACGLAAAFERQVHHLDLSVVLSWRVEPDQTGEAAAVRAVAAV